MSNFDLNAGDVRRPRMSARAPAGTAEQGKPSVFILILILAVVQPYYVFLGSIQMGPARGFLLLAMIPVMIWFLNGRAGKMLLPDTLVLCYAGWVGIAVFANYGASLPFNFLVAQMIETVVPYFLARCLIRDMQSFQYFVRCLLMVVLCLLPVAVVEGVLNVNILARLADAVPGLNTFHQVQHDQRLGLYRAQGPFEHPILFGLFCSIPFSLAWLALYPVGTRTGTRAFWSGTSVAGTFFSLSTGTYFSLVAQGGLLAWDTVMKTLKARWKLFAVGAVLGYVALDIVIESNPLLYLISNATMNTGSAWNRVLIWQHTQDDLMANPIFGIAYKDWSRPHWMLPSIDNYWLLVALRYGIPAFVLHLGGIIAMAVGIIRQDLSAHPMRAQIRMGYMITLGGLSVTLATVHIWSGTYIMFMFLIGAGGWLLSSPPETEAETAPGATANRQGARNRKADRQRPPPEHPTRPDRPARSRQRRYTRFRDDGDR